MDWFFFAAHGQDQLGDGRSLDANLQQGSGGVNPQGQTPNFNARNDVITGNVPGLGYFHDDVGYRATGEFGGRLGSDDLFRFRARSLSSSPSSVPGGGYTLGVAPGQVSVYRSQWAGGARNIRRPAFAGSGYVSSGLDVRAPGSAADVLTSPEGPPTTSGWDVRSYEQRIGTINQPEGRILEVKASPLLGLRRLETDSALDDQASPSDDDAADGSRPGPTVQRVPVVQWGQLIEQVVLNRQQTDRSAADNDRLVQQIEKDLFDPLDTPGSEADQSPYFQILTQIKRQTPAADQNAKQPSGQDKRASQGEPPMPAWMTGPSGDQLDQADAAWRRARQRSRSADAGRQSRSGQPSQEADAQNRLSEPMQRLWSKLDYDLPPVATLAGKKDTTVNQLIQQAQEEIRMGRFIDAEDRFRHVLRLQPNDPLAQVGLVHAQIGAGMMRSSALGLRWLFEHHPELIAARYEVTLLPAAQRLKWVYGELMKAIERGDHSDAVILLAYLGYQNGSPRHVKFALDLAGANHPDDPLIAVLRKIWLEQPKAHRAPAKPAVSP